jgi:uncharacterized membrane protein (DUF485 family)
MLTGLFVVIAAVFAGTSGSPEVARTGVVTGSVAYLGAIAAVPVAAFLLASGVFTYRGGTATVTWTDPPRAEHRVSERTRSKAVTAGIAFLIYGGLGIVTSVAFLWLSNPTAGVTVNAAGTALALVLIAWMIASVFLVIAAGIFTEFVRGVQSETRSSISFGVEGLVAYSCTNLVGVLLVTIPILLLESGATGVPGTTFIIGVVLEFIGIPIFGIVVFSRMTRGALRLPSLQPGQ